MSDDFDALFAAATAARANAYAPYSSFPVGAALRAPDGRIFAACNVENAAYPQGQCAEASAIGVMVASGATRIAEVVVLGGEVGDGLLCSPCGGCRQRLREFAAPDAPIHVCGPEGLRRTTTLAELLPLSFGPDNLGA
ncbi:MAG: cytidine deaminase [Alphaproteobacteria bacterium]